MRPLITLTTDFGTSSPYVAQVKAELYARVPGVEIVDITHAIRPQAISEGAVVLDDTTRRFPAGTLHIAVIDPGVGTDRSLLYAEIAGQRYLAPDNGLLTLLVQRSPATCLRKLTDSRYWAAEVSATFHGRDILAPVAAHLALGLAPEALGPAVASLQVLAIPRPQAIGDRVVGQVIFADSFGNLITNVGCGDLEQLGPPEELVVSCKSAQVRGIRRTYADGAAGTLLALFDSQGRLELAVVNGHAQQSLAATVGEAVVVSGGLVAQGDLRSPLSSS
jgi:S-adenosylmethionine hydrolase